MPSIYLNDIPIEALGLTLIDGGPALGGLRVSRDRQAWQGRVGAVPSSYGTGDVPVLTFVADVDCSTSATRTAALDALSDVLTGLVEVRYDDDTSRALRGVPRLFVAEVPVAPRFVNLEPRVTVEIECFTGAKFDVQPTSLAIGATPVPIPCGTLPHGGRLFLTGLNGNPLSGETRLRYRNAAGVILADLVLSPALSGGEYLLVNLDSPELIRYTNTGVASNVYAWKTGGSYPGVYPRDGMRTSGVWPTLELTNGFGLYVYRRLWRAPA